MTLFRDFHNISLPLHCLNFGTITLLPKAQEVTKIKQYAICMLNVSFKIFTKVIAIANRLLQVASKVIGPSQSTFLSGRNISEGVVVLHETLHELRRKKQKEII
jgi:hypothetical protein